MAPQWNPADPKEQEEKKAFENLSQSTDKVLLPSSDPAQPNRFILRSKGYFDLQAYVLSGKELPTSYAKFDAKITKTAFKKLTAFDTEIYTRRHCVHRFQLPGLPYESSVQARQCYAVTAGQAAIQFSDNTTELLENADGVNLRHNLDIILDEKYTSSSTFDAAYKDAKEAAKMTLGMLSDDAKEKQKKTDEITQTLITFKTDTLKNQPNVEFLMKQYKTGPVANNSKDHKTPYLEYLNKDLADSLVRFKNMVTEASEKYSEWDKNTAIAIGTCWFGPIGWIVMGIHAAKAVSLRSAYDDLQSQIARLQEDRQEETDLITFVNQMVTQCKDIGPKMTDAITAMTELSLLFSNQSDCYDKIAVSLDRMKTSTDLASLITRKKFIQYQIDVCTKKLKDLKVVAEEFTRSIITQVKL
ncbi:hypothetical protein BOTCAL_0832g00010 [Botryotinia calthae]|uniref:Enterotoxin n=1 Tax=Botryotinia calthae TaxID=38488 RepID=A0A4Y8CFM4_9HELO|nr:hypothetical protein BOTCAL_0832g00010 [Botryotinia calthae]